MEQRSSVPVRARNETRRRAYATGGLYVPRLYVSRFLVAAGIVAVVFPVFETDMCIQPLYWSVVYRGWRNLSARHLLLLPPGADGRIRILPDQLCDSIHRSWCF